MAWFGVELPIGLSISVNSVPNDLYSLLSVSPTISVGRDMLQSVKNAIYKVERIPPDEQRLIHAGKQLEELRTLSDCGIGPGTMLHLVFRISGGGCVERLADDDEGARCVSAPAQQPTGSGQDRLRSGGAPRAHFQALVGRECQRGCPEAPVRCVRGGKVTTRCFAGSRSFAPAA